MRKKIGISVSHAESGTHPSSFFCGEKMKKQKRNTPSPCVECSRATWAECYRRGRACEKLLLYARNLR